VLIGVFSQRLVTRIDGRGRVMALEILLNTPAVANLIRQEKIYQIKSVIQTNRNLGMQTMMSSLKQLVAEGYIHPQILKEYDSSLGDD
jgi:twitching motility protein PilT